MVRPETGGDIMSILFDPKFISRMAIVMVFFALFVEIYNSVIGFLMLACAFFVLILAFAVDIIKTIG